MDLFLYWIRYDTSTGYPTTITFTGLNYGDYTVRVIDNNGCESTSYLSLLPQGSDVLITILSSGGMSSCLVVNVGRSSSKIMDTF